MHKTTKKILDPPTDRKLTILWKVGGLIWYVHIAKNQGIWRKSGTKIFLKKWQSKEKKPPSINEISIQQDEHQSNFKTKNWNSNKPKSSLAYWCYICDKPNHKIYDCPHQVMTHAIMKDKRNNLVANNKAKHDKALVNMILVITTRSKVLENVAFKEKDPLKTKSTIEWVEEN